MHLPPLQSVNWFFFWMRACARPGVLYPGRFTYLERSWFMPGKRVAKPIAQKTLLASMWPLLPKPAVAVGKFAAVPGKFWDGCPSGDCGRRSCGGPTSARDTQHVNQRT